MQITIDIPTEEITALVKTLQRRSEAIKINLDGETIGRSVYEAIHGKPQED